MAGGGGLDWVAGQGGLQLGEHGEVHFAITV